MIPGPGRVGDSSRLPRAPWAAADPVLDLVSLSPEVKGSGLRKPHPREGWLRGRYSPYHLECQSPDLRGPPCSLGRASMAMPLASQPDL